ncbi:MAG: hypothetical protein DRN14_00205 [Thermoplasmata archaeon]|nr:MAG: hypothetical protein DRN14_00205 [Thermoplasmata archaeon]
MGTIKAISYTGGKYGVLVIGGRNSHWRYQTKDGVKHRSMKAVREHAEKELKRFIAEVLAKRWRAKIA